MEALRQAVFLMILTYVTAPHYVKLLKYKMACNLIKLHAILYFTYASLQACSSTELSRCSASGSAHRTSVAHHCM